jgi:NAD(P)H-dependent FMN reductase
MTIISVIVGSTRQGRFSEKPAQWIFQQLKNRGGIDAFLGHVVPAASDPFCDLKRIHSDPESSLH